MQFFQKLSFLMTVSNTTNKQLSQKLHVDPSLISLLKTGRRKLPKNNERIQDMADFFAKYCLAPSQLEMLYSQLKDVRLNHSPSEETLSSIIFSWLTDTSDQAGENSLNISVYPKDPGKKAVEKKTNYYYEISGKQKAISKFLQYIDKVSPDHTIYVCLEELPESETDSNIETELIDTLISRGFKICQILFSGENIEAALYSTQRWIHAYSSRNIEAFFYPRIRDNIYKKSMIILPGEISLTNSFISSNAKTFQTILSTDKNVVAYDFAIFNEYKRMCKPAFTLHSFVQDKCRCLDKYILREHSRLNFPKSLPTETLPSQILYLLKKNSTREQSKQLDNIQKYKDSFSSNLTSSDCIDICPVATPAQILSGKIPVDFPFITEEKLFYTPKTYALHLNSIITLMEKNPNYQFYPVPYSDTNQINGMVFDNSKAVFYSNTNPDILVEVFSPVLSKVLYEYAIRKVDYYNYKNREQIINYLKNYMTDLLSIIT